MDEMDETARGLWGEGMPRPAILGLCHICDSYVNEADAGELEVDGRMVLVHVGCDGEEKE